jgi:hypothetical protein
MTRLIAPIARVSIGKDDARDLFMSGDGLLRYVSVTLGEDARATRCRVEIYDPGLLLADKYFKLSFEKGGIEVPADLLQDPKAAAAGGGAISDPTLIATLSGGGVPSPDESIQLILAECQKQGVTDPNQIAYILATAQHESNQFDTLTEYASGERYEGWVEELGNTQPGDGPRFKGRGYVQVTGRANYEKYAKLTGVDLIAEPEKAADPGIAVFTLVHGMRTGHFTGVGLDDYIPAGGSPDFYSARQIVNSLDKADLIAGYAQEWLQKLPQYQSTTGQAQSTAAQQPAIQDTAATKPVEVSNKGTEIIVELGYQLDQMVAFHFIHVGTSTQGRQLDSTVWEGQSIRWLMTRRTKNTAYGNLTLRQLADQVASSYGLELEMEGNGPTYQYLDQTGITDYELLLREARAIGYSVREVGNKLLLKPWRPEFTGFVITQDVLQSIQFSDRASKDRSPTPGTTTSAPAVPAADPTTAIDPLTGQIQQANPEDTTAAGTAATRQPATTGAATKPVAGTPAPESAEKPAEGAATATPYTPPPPGTEEAPTDATRPVNPDPRAVLAESVTGLPNQEVGAIDLADGRAEAKEIKDESRRVKGYESQAICITTPELLTLAPGAIIGISRNIVPDTFAREWRVGSVTHTLQGGAMRSTLEFYTPQAMKSGGGSISDPSLVASIGGTAPPGALAVPCFLQTDNAYEPDRTCNTSACAMVAKFLGSKISGDDEYYKSVQKYGDTTDHSVQTAALQEVGIQSTWHTNLDFADLDQSLAAGKPVVIGILHRGNTDNPTGGHMIVVIGKTPEGDYIVNDPYGSLNDGYSGDPKTGCGAVYSRSVLQARWTANGSGSGWGRLF